MLCRRMAPWLVLVLTGLAQSAAIAQEPEPQAETEAPAMAPSEALLRSLETEQPELAELIREVLEKNPKIARQRRLAGAAAARAPQVRALPDPVAALNVFLLPPETRVGPQQFSASIQQRLPWFGKLALRQKAALLDAAAEDSMVEELRLNMLTEVRRLALELAFLDLHQRLVVAERSALVRYERSAQSRYASGVGLQSEIVRIQTQITRTDTLLLDIETRRLSLQGSLNALRDRPSEALLPTWQPLPDDDGLQLDRPWMMQRAKTRRPECARIEAQIARAEALTELAIKGNRPDVTLKLAYTQVGSRDDTSGRANPPSGNGDDIVSLGGSVNLPIRRAKLAAAVEEARQLRWAGEEQQRHHLAEVERMVGDLTSRIPLQRRHLKLLENVLLKQAREGLRSAETAYSTGKLNAVDLLDAEVVLFEVQIAAARTRADLALAWVELEDAIAGPWPSPEHLKTGTESLENHDH